jgi:hypothetical protein
VSPQSADNGRLEGNSGANNAELNPYKLLCDPLTIHAKAELNSNAFHLIDPSGELTFCPELRLRRPLNAASLQTNPMKKLGGLYATDTEPKHEYGGISGNEILNERSEGHGDNS